MIEFLKKFGVTNVGAARIWVHPAAVTGRFSNFGHLLGRFLIALLLIIPWLRWDDHPMILADLSTRQIFFFGAVFTPRDSVLFMSAVLSAGLLLFFVTSLWGRLWCGYACPQTVFLEEFIRRIERWVDGERGARLRMERAPWTAQKVGKRVLKWFLFLLVAYLVSFSFVGFFADARLLWTGRATHGTYVFASIVAAALWFDFAWFREQFCHYLCPYARIQSVLTDEHTIQIHYDPVRGEPRKERGVAVGANIHSGACVDCNRCVTVCPAGIDIRQGFQMECIACARCIDACTDVMGKLGEPTLISYIAQAQLDAKAEAKAAGLSKEEVAAAGLALANNKRRFRPRPWFYGIGLTAASTVFVVSLVTRSSFDVTVSQDATTAETITADGASRNLYQLTIHNNSQRTNTYDVLIDLPGAELTVPGAPISVPPAGRRVVPAFVTLHERTAAPVTRFTFSVVSQGQTVKHDVTFRQTRARNSQ